MTYALIMRYMQGDERSSQQSGALMHTKLPSIRTRLKQRPGKRRPPAATSLAQLPWMQEWIATGAPLAVTTICTSKASGKGTELKKYGCERAALCMHIAQLLCQPAGLVEFPSPLFVLLSGFGLEQGGQLRTGRLQRSMKLLVRQPLGALHWIWAMRSRTSPAYSLCTVMAALPWM